MQRRFLAVAAVALIALLAAMAMGSYGYRVGMAQGLAEAGKLPAAAVPYAYYGGWHGPFFFGGPFVGLLVLFFVFSLFRRALWGRCGGRFEGYGRCGSGVPRQFEEWHRRAHEAPGEGGSRV